MEQLHWRMRYEKDKANGSRDRRGEWAVLVERDGRTEERYFPDQETANKYVEENGLEGRVPIFEVD